MTPAQRLTNSNSASTTYMLLLVTVTLRLAAFHDLNKDSEN